VAWVRLSLNPKKYYFFTEEVDILGYYISYVGIRLLLKRIAAFENWLVLINDEEVLRFYY